MERKELLWKRRGERNVDGRRGGIQGKETGIHWKRKQGEMGKEQEV